MARLKETGMRALARRHSTRETMISAALETLLRDTGDLYGDRINFGERIVFTERFLQAPKLKADLETFTAGGVTSTEMLKYAIANKNFSIIGTNAADAGSLVDVGGGAKISTAGADADSIIIHPQLSTNQSAWTKVTWPTSKEVHFHTIVTGRSAVFSAQTFWAGLKLTNTPVVGTDDDQIFFRYQDTLNGGRWQVIYSKANSDTTTNVTAAQAPAVAVDVPNLLSIIIDENRVASCYIDGVLVYTSSAMTSVSLIPYVGVLAAAAAVKSLTCQGLILSRKAA